SAAGPDQTVTAGATVSLSGAGSTDPDGDALTYEWAQTSGPAVTFSPSSTVRDVSFVAPAVTASTAIAIRLRVRDAFAAQTDDVVTVTVNPAAGGSPIVAAATDTPIAIPDNNATGITSTITVTA